MNKNNKTKAQSMSVVIPCYNASKEIIRTIDSVLAQTLKPQQLVVVNDGSQDDSALIVWEYRERINAAGIKLLIISQPNKGVSAARNRGVEESNGDLIAFLDADDIWRPTKLAEHHKVFANDPTLGISFARCEIHNLATQSSTVSSLPMGAQNMSSVFSENPTTTSSNLVVRRQLFVQLGGFDESMSFAEDQEFIMRAIAKSQFSVTGIDKILVDYMCSENGLSAKLQSMHEGWLFMVAKIRIYAPDFVEQHFEQANARYCYYLARRNLRLNANAKQGWHFSKQALKSDWRYIFVSPLRTLPIIAINFTLNFLRQCGLALPIIS